MGKMFHLAAFMAAFSVSLFGQSGPIQRNPFTTATNGQQVSATNLFGVVTNGSFVYSVNTNIIVGSGFPPAADSLWNHYFLLTNGTYSYSTVYLTNQGTTFYGFSTKASQRVTNTTPNVGWVGNYQWSSPAGNIPGTFVYLTNVVALNQPIPNNLNIPSLTLPDGTVTNLSDIPFEMPWPMQSALVQMFRNDKTAYWDTNGNDSTAVLGDPSHPSSTFTNAAALLPAGGGSIWLTPEQHFQWTDVTITAPNKPIAFVALGKTTSAGYGQYTFSTQLLCSTNLSFYGGTWDVVVYAQSGMTWFARYATFYPDTGPAGSVDVFYDNAGATGSVQLTDVDYCKMFSTFDCFNTTPGPVGAGSVGSIKHSWLISRQDPLGSSGANPTRTISVQGSHQLLVKDCLLVACGAVNSGGLISTNVCVQATGGAVVTLDNTTMICGFTNFDYGLQVLADGVGSAIYIRNMVFPTSYLTSNGGVISTTLDINAGTITATNFTGNSYSSLAPHTPVAVTVGASPFSFTNNNAGALECYFSGGTAFSVSKNGAAVYGSLIGDSYFVLQPTNKCVITYTVAPTFFTNAW